MEPAVSRAVAGALESPLCHVCSLPKLSWWEVGRWVDPSHNMPYARILAPSFPQLVPGC